MKSLVHARRPREFTRATSIRVIFCCLALGSAAWTGRAAAQFSIDHWVVAGGGGASNAGNLFSLAGTTGQTETGIVTGNAWILTGGFWSAQEPDPASVPGTLLPTRFASLPCSPNPVRGDARFAFDLPRAGRVRLELYSISGRRLGTLFDRTAAAGRLDFAWKATGADGRRLASGVYFVVAQLGGERFTQHVVVLD